jgi:hypothetical protein
MKRLFAVLLLLVPALVASADRDVLLTPRGTVYSVETAFSAKDVTSASSKLLLLTEDNAGKRTTIAIPESLTGGENARPALAYDDSSETLFVFWERATNWFLREMMLGSYQNGKWNGATSADSKMFRMRYNLRVAVTRTYEEADTEGNVKVLPGLTVHATWWEDAGLVQEARYAMLTVEKGAVTDIQTRSLTGFVTTTDIDPVNPNLDSEILRRPMLIENAGRGSVDVIFGDVTRNRMHRIRLKPVSDGRIRIPIGRREERMQTPKMRIDSDAQVSALAPDGDALAIYAATVSQVTFVTLEAGGKWSDARTIKLNDGLSAEAAVEALRKMVAGK